MIADRILESQENAINSAADEKFAASHTTNKRPSNWDKHTKKRPGAKEKKDDKMDWSKWGNKTKKPKK